MWTRSDAVVQLEAHDDSVTGGHTHMTYIPRNNLIYVYLRKKTKTVQGRCATAWIGTLFIVFLSLTNREGRVVSNLGIFQWFILNRRLTETPLSILSHYRGSLTDKMPCSLRALATSIKYWFNIFLIVKFQSNMYLSSPVYANNNLNETGTFDGIVI